MNYSNNQTATYTPTFLDPAYENIDGEPIDELKPKLRISKLKASGVEAGNAPRITA